MGNITKLPFHQRFFDDLSDMMDGFEPAFIVGEEPMGPVELFFYSQSENQILPGRFYDAVEDRERILHFTFSHFHTLDGHRKDGVVARGVIDGEQILLYGVMDEHDLIAFYPCVSAENREVRTFLFAN